MRLMQCINTPHGNLVSELFLEEEAVEEVELALHARVQMRASHARASHSTHLVLSGSQLPRQLLLQALEREVHQAVVQELGDLEPESASARHSSAPWTCVF